MDGSGGRLADLFLGLPDLDAIFAGIFRQVKGSVRVINQLTPIGVEARRCRADADACAQAEGSRRGAETRPADCLMDLTSYLQGAILVGLRE